MDVDLSLPPDKRNRLFNFNSKSAFSQDAGYVTLQAPPVARMPGRDHRDENFCAVGCMQR
jgi:hypothetical protein